MHRQALFVALLVITVGLVISCGSDTPESKAKTPDANPTTQAQKPAASTDMSASTVARFTAKDLEGSYRNSDEWIGKQPVVINFWGTWCGPCRREVPELVKLYEEYRSKGVEIIGLAVRDKEDRVKAFAEQYGMNWVMLMADYGIAANFNVTGVPKTVFIDRDGKIVDQYTGLRSYNSLKQAFESIL